MSDEQKNTKEKTLNCCEGMPFAEMMQKMMNQQGEGLGFDCSEMMSQMTTMCCQQQDEREETRKEGKGAQTANQ